MRPGRVRVFGAAGRQKERALSMTQKKRPPAGVLFVVAGYDPCGGGGVLADLRAARFCGVRAVAALTALTAQNTSETTQVTPVSPDDLREQLRLLEAEFVVGAVKIGMLGQAKLASVAANFLRRLSPGAPVVLDPVLRASAGASLLDAPDVLSGLLPLCSLVTPNREELQRLTGCDDPEKGAARLLDRGARAVLVKGGHAPGDGPVVDVLYRFDAKPQHFAAARWPFGKIRGTGCFLASAIAARLLWGDDLPAAVQFAHDLLQQNAPAAWQPSAQSHRLLPDWPVESEEIS